MASDVTILSSTYSNNGATYTDTNFRIALAASTKYSVEGCLAVACSNPSEGFKFGFLNSTVTPISYAIVCAALPSATMVSDFMASNFDALTYVNNTFQYAGTTAEPTLCYLHGYISVGATGAGSLILGAGTLDWVSNQLAILNGSWLRLSAGTGV